MRKKQDTSSHSRRHRQLSVPRRGSRALSAWSDRVVPCGRQTDLGNLDDAIPKPFVAPPAAITPTPWFDNLCRRPTLSKIQRCRQRLRGNGLYDVRLSSSVHGRRHRSVGRLSTLSQSSTVGYQVSALAQCLVAIIQLSLGTLAGEHRSPHHLERKQKRPR